MGPQFKSGLRHKTEPANTGGFLFPLSWRSEITGNIIQIYGINYSVQVKRVMYFRPTFVIITLILAASVLSLFPLYSQAQTNDVSCPALVELALSQVGNNCGNLDRNTACYGFNRVDATFSQTVSEGFFTRPAETTTIETMKTIRTAPLDLGLAQWGIAVMKVQANIPDTLPGQAVTFLLVGDAEVENAVISAEAGTIQPITVIIQNAVDLRAAPEANSTIVGTLAAGTVLQADGLSTDGLSIRVISSLGVGWIDRDTVNQTEALNNLPTASTAQSPMQAFYFRTGAGQTTCSQTPSLLAIQSPENITIDITANGANIRLGSLATLQTLPSGDQMQLTVLEGKAVLEAGTPNEVTVLAGNTSTRCLLPPEDLGTDAQTNDQLVGPNCNWTPPQPITITDLEQGQSAQSILERIGLSRPPVTTTPTTEAVECPLGTTLTHTVSAGENLYRISLRYRTSMGAIMTANNITNSQLIYVGQRLTIPCGVDTGIPSVPNPQQPGQPPATLTNNVDCSGFRATSPLDGLPYGSATFYWDPAPGVTGYRVNLYNLDETGGALVGSFGVGDATSVTANLSIESVGYGFSFAWEVQALLNGQAVCTTPRVTVPRSPPPASCPATSSC